MSFASTTYALVLINTDIQRAASLRSGEPLMFLKLAYFSQEEVLVIM